MNNKIVAILAVVVVVVAGAAVAITMNQHPAEKKGLYKLDATILDVDMGGMSGTPKLVDTIEEMYYGVYGTLAAGAESLTIADAKANTDFWDKYCKYTSVAKVNLDGSITFKSIVDETTKTQDVSIPGPANKLIATGSAYAFTQYYYICAKYNVTPFSDEAKNNASLVAEFQALNFAGLNIDDIRVSSAALAEYYPSTYISHCSSMTSYDKEELGKDVKAASNNGENIVIVMASGTIDKVNNVTSKNTVNVNGGEILFNNAKDIPATFAMIEEIGIILGYSEYTEKVIEDLQLRLYKIFYSAQQKAETHKVFFESKSGKAAGATSSGKALCEFLGWNTELFDGAEHDTEELLTKKPDILMFYTNDDRGRDVQMRAL